MQQLAEFAEGVFGMRGAGEKGPALVPGTMKEDACKHHTSTIHSHGWQRSVVAEASDHRLLMR